MALKMRTLFVICILSVCEGCVYRVPNITQRWQTSSIYEVWTSTFKDSNGDGVGDIKGIYSKMDYLASMYDFIWLPPIYMSPLFDSGYDISDHKKVNSLYGTNTDLKELIDLAHKFGVGIILDFVPNHTSDEHEWFKLAKQGIEPYFSYYVWNKGVERNGKREPPNNWINVFNTGSAWEWVEELKAFYLHQFGVKQPDLNLTNPLVRDELKGILKFWLDYGVDGFRVDSTGYLIEDENLEDEPPSNSATHTGNDYYSKLHYATKDRLENFEIIREWRKFLDEYSLQNNRNEEIFMCTEAYANMSTVTKYHYYRVIPMNFFLIKDEDGIDPVKCDTAAECVGIMCNYLNNLPPGAFPNWQVGNHDNSRIATRYGVERLDGMEMLLKSLPGMVFDYNGDEIGMTNANISWEDTKDPQACSTDPSRYEQYSRDPVRTPFQWDNTTSAGFSINESTIIKVNPNYVTLNLEAQMKADTSHYKIVRKLKELRDSHVFRRGDLELQAIDNVIVLRRDLDGSPSILVLMNWGDSSATISLANDQHFPDYLEVVIADTYSGMKEGQIFPKDNIGLPGYGAAVLRGKDDSENNIGNSPGKVHSPMGQMVLVKWFQNFIQSIREYVKHLKSN